MKKLLVGLLAGITFNLTSAQTMVMAQAGTFNNLTAGIYEGSTPLKELYQDGDFGLGTVNGLLGEMVVLEGKAYLADKTGKAKIISSESFTPYTMIIRFKPTQSFPLTDLSDIKALKSSIDAKLESTNLFYAMKIEGEFTSIKMRDIDPPIKPYQPLAQWIKNHEHIYDLKNIKGTLIVIRSPDFMGSLTVPGYHLHFISADRKLVGHIYDVAIKKAMVSITPAHDYLLKLPSNASYLKANLSDVSNENIYQTENK